jgi:hypothetical protein
MSPMCNSQLLLYLKMFLIDNISTHQAGNEERKEGGRKKRKEQMKEAHLYTYMLRILRYINLPNISFCPKFSVWEGKQYVTV